MLQMQIDFFRKAIEIDPKYAPAHAQLAFAYGWTALTCAVIRTSDAKSEI
jgi:hypothetical protein